MGQADLIYFSTLIVDIRNQPIVGLCGYHSIYSCFYRIISYSLTSSTPNWTRVSYPDSNPRSFYYDSTNDLLYVGGVENYNVDLRFLMILKQNADNGANVVG